MEQNKMTQADVIFELHKENTLLLLENERLKIKIQELEKRETAPAASGTVSKDK